MATIIDIADAIVAELNGESFSQPFTAERAYKPTFDLQEMQDLHVTVVPKELASQQSSRSMVQQDFQIDIGIQKKLEADDAETDALMALVEEIADFFRRGRLEAVPNAGLIRTENAPVFSPEHLSELRQFTSVLTLTYRMLR